MKFLILLAIAACASLTGCSRHRLYFGEPIDLASVEALSSGKTTKFTLLDTFGMPLAIAEQGETLSLRTCPLFMYSIAAHVVDDDSYKQSADTFFEVFCDNQDWGPSSRVYYYQSSTIYQNAFYMIFVIQSNDYVFDDRLWVLVDEDKGVVADYLFIRQGKELRKKFR